jgi:hypothetical protein
LFFQKGSNDIARIEVQTRVIAINIPNIENVDGIKWGESRLRIDDLESLKGMIFNQMYQMLFKNR